MNKFSWNHDRSYLLQVMVNNFLCGSGSQSRTLYNMGNLSKTYLKLISCEVSFAHSLFHICSIVLKCILHSNDTCSVWNIKNNRKLKGMLWTNKILRDLRWVADGYPTLHIPTGVRFFLAIPCHASQTTCDRDSCSWSVGPIVTAVEYEVLRNLFFR